jgi:hypothetical protein
MRALIPLACSIALAATLAQAQVNGPITISPHDDTPSAAPPTAAAPEPHATGSPPASAARSAPAPNPAPPASSAVTKPANPAPPSASLVPPAEPAPASKRARQAMPQHPSDLYGGPPEGPAPELAPERPHGLRARFEAANVTHDGRLTPEQAMMGGMHGIAKHFAEIDRGSRGYVTLQEIRAWRRARHRQNMAPPAAEPGGPGMPGRSPEPGEPEQNQ